MSNRERTTYVYLTTGEFDQRWDRGQGVFQLWRKRGLVVGWVTLVGWDGTNAAQTRVLYDGVFFVTP